MIHVSAMTDTCLECGADLAGEPARFCSRVCGNKWLSVMLEAPPALAAARLDEGLCAEERPTTSTDSRSPERGESLNQEEEEEVEKRRRCTRCGNLFTPGEEDFQGRQERHHIIPRAAGGPDHPLNLVDLCHECHTRVHREMKRLPEEKPELFAELRDFVCTP